MFATGCATWKTQSVVIYGGPTSEAALLRVPANVDIRSIDNEYVSKDFGHDELLIQIGPGSHKAEVRYSTLYPTTGNDYEKIQSDYFIISFDCLTGGTYRVECADPQTLDETRRFARNPSFLVLPHVIAVKSAPAPTTLTFPPASVIPAQPPSKTDSSSNLKREWEKASPADRKAFLDSINPPPR